MTTSPAPISELASEAESPTAPGLPRLLAGIPERGAMSLDEHLALHGEVSLARGRARGGSSSLIDRVDRSGLRGRGGGDFPTATKMRAVASGRRRAVVVINAAEGEPASLKDRTLIQTLPHLVLDGGELAAQAVGANELVVCVCESAGASFESVAGAIGERGRSPAGAPRARLVAVPGRYVAGQESALVNLVNGGPAIPTFVPPMPFEQGVRRRPTLINNPETLAHIALIARHGSQWFRELGPPTQPGSALVTLSGPVAQPGVYEIEHGASLASLIEAAGGATTRLRAALIGGYSGTWIGAEYLRGLALSNEHLASHRASLGAGVVLLLSEDACPVSETVRVAHWLARESAGQCGPCVHGLDALATTVDQIARGVAEAKAERRVAQLASLVRRRGACGHPDGAVNFILSALDAFAVDFADHAKHGRCDACDRPSELPLPTEDRGGTPSPAGVAH